MISKTFHGQIAALQAGSKFLVIDAVTSDPMEIWQVTERSGGHVYADQIEAPRHAIDIPLFKAVGNYIFAPSI